MWGRRRRELELEKEIRAHLETEAAELADNGLAVDEARLAARRAFGNTTSITEVCREMWGWATWERLWLDVRFSLRGMRRSAVYTAIAVFTLALGIGANTAIFSVVRGILLRPLEYKDPDRIVTILHGKEGYPIAPANFVDFQRQAQSFERMAAAGGWGASLTGGEHPEQLRGLQLSEGMFELLGVPPLIGRWPVAQEYQPGKDAVVMLSYRLWQRRFGADPAIVGQHITLDGRPVAVIGVMPESFQFAPFWITETEMWAPLTVADKAGQRGGQFMRVFARLKAGVAVEQAQTEMTGIMARLAQAYPAYNAKRTLSVEPLSEKVVGNVRQALFVLLGAVGFVLLIACSNMANLALARATERQKEVAIRMALGAGRWRLLRQMLTESVVVALVGGALGLLLAWWGVEVFKKIVADASGGFGARIPRAREVGLDGLVLCFTAGVSLLSGILFGLAPALQSIKTDVNDSLKEGARGTSEGGGGLRLRSVLVVSEVAITLVLLAGAGLLMRSFVSLRALDPGFNPRGVLTMQVSLAGMPNYAGAPREMFYRSLIKGIRALPGVQSASAVNHIPIGGDTWGNHIQAEGQPVPQPGDEIDATYRTCRPEYFRTMGIRIVKGRDFTDRDDENSPPVLILNEKLAKRLWGDENPIGKRVQIGGPPLRAVVGVIGNVKQGNWSAEPGNEYYLPFQQDSALYAGTRPWTSYMTVVLRTELDPLSLSKATQSVVWSLEKNAPISELRSMEQFVGSALWRARFQMVLLALFAGFAIVLAAVGMYGVVAYSVSRRAHEIGIRMALGAGRGQVVWMMLRQGLGLVLVGIAIGLVAAFLVTRSMETLLFGVKSNDPLTFALIPCLLGVVAAFASYLPARRASGVDPVVALRCE